MTAPLSQDLRKRLVQAVEEGASAREAAARFVVSASAAIKLGSTGASDRQYGTGQDRRLPEAATGGAGGVSFRR